MTNIKSPELSGSISNGKADPGFTMDIFRIKEKKSIMSEAKPRLKYIDIAKALSIFLLVLGHTLGYSEHCSGIYKAIYSFVVPLFFLVSGFVMKVKGTYRSFCFSRVMRIVIPYFIWAFLFLIPYAVLGNSTANSLDMEGQSGITDLIKNVFYGIGKDGALRQNSSLWFLPALFSMEVAYYLLIRVIDKRNNWKIDVAALMGLCIFGYIVSRYLKIALPWGINTVLVAGPYFYAGYLLRKYCLIEKIGKNKFCFAVLIAIGLLGLICGQKNSLLGFMSYTYENMLLGYISGIGLSVVTLLLAYRIRDDAVLEKCGCNTMSIMIFHKLVVLLFQTRAGKITTLLKCSNLVVELLLSVAITVMAIGFSLVVASVLRRIAPFSIGEWRRKHI